jgi:hypothetical protein
LVSVTCSFRLTQPEMPPSSPASSVDRAEMESLLLENRASGVLIDEPKFETSIRQEPKAVGDIFYFRAHGRNAKAWWNFLRAGDLC